MDSPEVIYPSVEETFTTGRREELRSRRRRGRSGPSATASPEAGADREAGSTFSHSKRTSLCKRLRRVLALSVKVLILRLKRKLRRKGKDREGHPPEDKDSEELPRFMYGYERFSLDQLWAATRGFSPSMLISRDSYASRYAGMLQGREVSIVRYEGERYFLAEAEALWMLRHRSIANGMVGWCREGRESFVVLEATGERGSLDDYLHSSDRDTLPWDVRFRIALDLASAVHYMHEQCERCVLHRDIKSRNVLLDSDFNAKLTSFEFSRIMDHQMEVVQTVVVGTLRYIDPQYMITGYLSRGSDVYSFGVVLLEIATWRWASDLQSRTIRTKLVEEVRRLRLQDKSISTLVDERLGGKFDPAQMERLITAGLHCTLSNRDMRPSMQQVMQFLQSGVALPSIELEELYSSMHSSLLQSGVALPSIEMEELYSSMHSSPRSQTSSGAFVVVEEEGEEEFDPRKGKHVMDQSEIGEKPIAAEESLFEIEKPVLDGEPSFTGETLDIGIPSSYNESGSLNESQLQIVKGFAATLHDNIESGARLTDVSETIKKFTSILVTLRAPLREWDSLAQHVLAEVQRMEALRGKLEGDKQQRARTLSSLRARFEGCLATVHEDSAKLAEAKEKLAAMEQERASSVSKFDNLQKQLVDIQNQMEAVEGTLNLSEDSMEIINRWRAQSIERTEYMEFAILTLHESLISRVPSFLSGGERAQPEQFLGDTSLL